MVMYMTVPIFLLVQVLMNVFHAHVQGPSNKLLFIIDTYEKDDDDMSFNQLRRFLNDIVNELQEKNPCQVITLNGTTIDKFSCNRKKANWLESIRQSNISHGIIEHKPINDEISIFFDKNENEEMASEEIYLLVNDKTVVDNVVKLKAAMQNRKVQIVLYGTHTKGDVWSQLSEDEQLIHVLDDDDKSINVTVESVKRQSKIGKETSHSDTTPTTKAHDDKSQMDNSPSYDIHPTINTIWIILLSIYVFRKGIRSLWTLLWNRIRANNDQRRATEDQRRATYDQRSTEVTLFLGNEKLGDTKDGIQEDDKPRGVPPSGDPLDSVEVRPENV